MQHNYLMDNLNALFCISLQQTTFVYVLKRRSNTQCKTEKSHTAVSHRTNRSHTGDNARNNNPLCDGRVVGVSEITILCVMGAWWVCQR